MFKATQGNPLGLNQKDRFIKKNELENSIFLTNLATIEISNIKNKTDAVDFPVVFSVQFNKGTTFETEVLKLLEIARS